MVDRIERLRSLKRCRRTAIADRVKRQHFLEKSKALHIGRRLEGLLVSSSFTISYHVNDPRSREILRVNDEPVFGVRSSWNPRSFDETASDVHPPGGQEKRMLAGRNDGLLKTVRSKPSQDLPYLQVAVTEPSVPGQYAVVPDMPVCGPLTGIVRPETDDLGSEHRDENATSQRIRILEYLPIERLPFAEFGSSESPVPMQ